MLLHHQLCPRTKAEKTYTAARYWPQHPTALLTTLSKASPKAVKVSAVDEPYSENLLIAEYTAR